jgi:hypothetical protein
VVRRYRGAIDAAGGNEGYLPRGKYQTILPQSLSRYKKQPDFSVAPLPVLEAAPAKGKPALPPGVYAQTARAEDLFVMQSLRPAGVILELNAKTARSLEAGGLPFKPAELILSLPEYLPESRVAFYREALPKLAKAGCTKFIVNNLGYFSLLRNIGTMYVHSTDKPQQKKPAPPLTIIIGPHLPTMNAWSLAFLATCYLLPATYYITSLENSRQNLAKTLDCCEAQGARMAGRLFVTVYAHPEDSEADSDAPFVLTDKIPFLQKAGINRFILDFSAQPLKKHDYKELATAAKNGELPWKTREDRKISRYKWK